jgi:glycine cleavage system aminomethyltransferase T
MLGREPVLTRGGESLIDPRGRRSYVTSAGAAPSLGRHILMSYLPPEHAIAGNELAVEYMGERYPVTVRCSDSTPLLDPAGARIRA